MKQLLYLISFLITTSSLVAQNANQLQIEKELKEIVAEANRLFSYRVMEWWASDLTEQNKELDRQVADYILYHDEENIYFVLLDETYENKLGTYYLSTFKSDGKIQFDSTQGKISREERKHYQLKNRMEKNAAKLVNEKIDYKEGFSVSSILIKQRRGYKLYLLANTTEIGIIPIGNDGVFNGNNRGKIKSWALYHNELSAIPVSKEGVKLSMHKHDENQPLISPTEIANFHLYGMLYNMTQMPIIDISKGIIIEYDALENVAKAFYPKK